MLEKDKHPDISRDQVMCVPSLKNSLGEEDVLGILNELMTTISPAELEAITDMVNNPKRKAEISPTAATLPVLSLSLEIAADNGAEPHLIPVTLKNLGSEMVVLRADNFKGIANPASLQGKLVTWRLTDPETQESMKINAIMTWTRCRVDKEITIILRMLNAQADHPAGKTLGNSPPLAVRETQWYQELLADTNLSKADIDKRDNFLLLCLACGTIGSSLIEPKAAQLMQYLLSVIGLGNVIKFLRERLR